LAGDVSPRYWRGCLSPSRGRWLFRTAWPTALIAIAVLVVLTTGGEVIAFGLAAGSTRTTATHRSGRLTDPDVERGHRVGSPSRRLKQGHIARSGTEKLRPGELGDAYQPLLGLVKRSAQGPDEWTDLERAVAQLPDVPPRFEKWLRRQRKALPRLWERRIDDMPCGSGPLEEALDEINRSIRHRRFRFRNLGRLERVLAMMLLHQNHVADERRYAAIITDYLLRHGGYFPELMGRWRRYADPKATGSSVRELAKQAALRLQAEKLLTQPRQLHRKLARAWEKGQPLFD